MTAPAQLPALCPQCLAAGIVAEPSGPTCAHNLPAGADWWPAGWATMPEPERIDWLRARK